MSVHVTLFFDFNNCLKKIVSIGHTASFGFFENKSRLAVCAAITAIEYQLLYSIKALVNEKVEFQVANGTFSLIIPPVEPQKKISGCCVETLLSSYIIGLQMIQKKNPSLISIERCKFNQAI